MGGQPGLLEQALALHQTGQIPEAIELYQQILAIQPKHPDALHLLGMANAALGQCTHGIQYVEKAVSLKPDSALFHNNLANLYQDEGKMDQAIAAYEQAIACFNTVIELKPDYPEANFNLANTLSLLDRYEQAIAAYQAALAIQPSYPAAHTNLGNVFSKVGNMEQAKLHYEKALELTPNAIEPLNGLGNCYKALGKLDRTFDIYRRATILEPSSTELYLNLGRPLVETCSWAVRDEYIQSLAERLEQHIKDPNAQALDPFSLNYFEIAPQLKKAVAEHRSQQIERKIKQRYRKAQQNRLTKKKKIHIGYLSADFRNHAIGTLIHHLFPHHDRERFEVSAYSLKTAKDCYQQKIERSVDHFIELDHLCNEESAKRIDEDGIDILIDCAGYTAHCRPKILAHRPAPIQISYLGYLDTMGAEFIDYIIADDTVITPEMERDFSERILRLPDSFMVAGPMEKFDKIALDKPAREEYGINQETLVFCCFNHYYKITPTLFDSWMKILNAVPNSILWLMDNGSEIAKRNLRERAVDRGINPERLQFAPLIATELHQLRYKLCDIALDTIIYNGGATSLGALWADVPVVTLPGNTLLSRMGASFNRALDLNHLTATDLDNYEAIAIDLARNKAKLSQLKQSIRRSKERVLFNPKRFSDELEKLLLSLFENNSDHQSN